MTVTHSPGFKNFNFLGVANFCPTVASLWIAAGQAYHIDTWNRFFEPRILMKDFPQGWPQFVYFCKTKHSKYEIRVNRAPGRVEEAI